MKRVVGLGAGGHSKVVIEVLRLMGGCEVMGLLDAQPALWGTTLLGVPILGDDSLLPRLYAQGVRHAFIGVGSVGDTRPRRRLHDLTRQQGFEIVRVIHPQAVIAPSVHIGQGPTIMAGVVINAAARLEDHVIVNTGAIIEHDCLIGSHVHIATGVRLASTVQVGEGTHIGVGASIRQCVRIGHHAVVGVGAAVVEDVPDNTVVVGVPARPLREGASQWAT